MTVSSWAARRGIAAAVVAVATLSAAACSGSSSTSAHEKSPSAPVSSSIPTTSSTDVPAVTIGADAQPPGTLPVAVAHLGPYGGNVATIAGHVWAAGGTGPHGAALLEISPDGKTVVQKTVVPGLSPAEVPPFGVGNAIYLPASSKPNSNADVYAVFDLHGHLLTTTHVPGAGTGAGDSPGSGGWVGTGPNTIAHVDASGRRLGKTVTLPDLVVNNGMAFGGGSLWMADLNEDKVLRLDATTGQITGSVKMPGRWQPGGVTYGDGAVYVELDQIQSATLTGILRIDPTTMRATARAIDARNVNTSIAFAPDGDMWISTDVDTVVQVDPVTLVQKRAIQFVPDAGDDQGESIAIADGRLYFADVRTTLLYSFAL